MLCNIYAILWKVQLHVREAHTPHTQQQYNSYLYATK